MQENAKMIKESGLLSEEVYNNDYFNGSDDLVDSDDLEKDYQIVGKRSTDSGFQGLLLKNGNDYVFVFRGTEGNLFKDPLSEVYKDLIVSDIMFMGTGRIPQQKK
jgi:hypothetical protein